MPFIALVRRAPKGVLALVILALNGTTCLAQEPAPQWIVVTPPEFREALAPLVHQRRTQGFKVVVIQTTDVLSQQQLRDRDGTPLQAKLNEFFRESKSSSYVLLAGGFGMGGLTNASSAVVPPLRGITGRMKGESTDSGYGLPAPDGTPTVAVGRFPARDRGELGAMVRKTLSFEQDAQPAPWRNRLLLLIGNPGGGPLAEMFMQQSLADHLATLHPAWQVRMTFNVASSPYYLPRPRDREAALRYLQEGEMFSVYLGHSSPAGLGLDARFITRKDWAEVRIPHGGGPFFTLGCFALQSSAKADGYGLAAMRNPAGPVAVIGATGETYSAPGQLAVEGLLGSWTLPAFPVRVGDYWLAVQAGLARGKMDSTTFALLDMADGTGGKVPLAAQRREHLEMWLLLGDPALRLPVVPVDISLRTDQPIRPGTEVDVSGLLPDGLKDATVRVSLERPLNSVPTNLEEPPPNSPADREARERVFMARHQSANSFVLATTEAKASGNHFTASVTAPDTLPWSNVVIRASATLSNETGIGVVAAPVKP
jgi:hypothetical protein